MIGSGLDVQKQMHVLCRRLGWQVRCVFIEGVSSSWWLGRGIVEYGGLYLWRRSRTGLCNRSVDTVSVSLMMNVFTIKSAARNNWKKNFGCSRASLNFMEGFDYQAVKYPYVCIDKTLSVYILLSNMRLNHSSKTGIFTHFEKMSGIAKLVYAWL